jgi:hypothetical protein
MARHKEQPFQRLLSERRYRRGIHFPSNSTSRDSARALALCGPIYGANLAATRPATYLPGNSLSSDSQRVSTGRLDIGSSSSSDYLPSDAIAEAFIYRATRPAEYLPTTPPELYHCAVRDREQIFQRLTQQLTCRAQSFITCRNKSPSSDSLSERPRFLKQRTNLRLIFRSQKQR